jgi:two-component system sensor histidine kinase YesM
MKRRFRGILGANASRVHFFREGVKRLSYFVFHRGAAPDAASRPPRAPIEVTRGGSFMTKAKPRSGRSAGMYTYSLKYRLILILVVSTLTPLAIIGSISYLSMYDILKNKAEAGVRSNLHQVRVSLDETLGHLNHASQQLAFDGRVGKNLESYLSADLYEKKQLSDEIRNEISLIHFTNPTLGLMFYYFANERQILFENYSVSDDFDLGKLPVLFKYNQITYYGPHMSNNPIDGHIVLSISRKVDLPDRDDVYVYIETNFKMAETIIQGDQFGGDLIHLIADPNGRIVYSEAPDRFPRGMVVSGGEADGSVAKDYLVYEESSNQEWMAIAAISKSNYRSEITRWELQFALFAALTLVASCLIAWLVWRTVYRPLSLLGKDIRSVERQGETFPERRSRIREFAAIYREFAEMRSRIGELIVDVEVKEKGKARLEVEKLMAQINPHFIHNTLDTIRWLARGNGQKEIDRLVSNLNKVLHYNLGKGGQPRLAAEIEALRSYVDLQAVRYNFQFDVRIEASPEVLDLPIPRFILQPLVENALLHGLGDDGIIEVRVTEEGGTHLRIRVADNGEGIGPEEIERLVQEESPGGRKTGMGIGLRYVYQMMRFQFGAEASFRIHSEAGSGTTIELLLPLKRGEGDSF